MSSRKLVACLPLAVGSALISVAIVPLMLFGAGAFVLEWVGSFLAFYGLSYLAGTRISLPLAGVVLVAGSLGDMMLLGGLTPTGWALTNYMVFIHAIVGSLTGNLVREKGDPD